MSLEFRTSQEPGKKIPAWTLVIVRPRKRRKIVWNAHLKENGTPSLKKWWKTSKNELPVFRGISALNRGIPKRKRRKMHYSLQCGFFDHGEAFVSHNYLSNGSKSRITKATTATWSSYVLMIQTKILVNHKGVERPIAMQSEPGQANMEISWSIEETHASQPKIQSNPGNGHSEDSIPSKERKWNDILANRNLKRNTFESDVAKLVMKLVRHHDQDERETDGSFHWKSMGPKLRFAFHK